MIACMGGWCTKRQQCPHYIEAKRVKPEERLCLRGQDGVRLVNISQYKSITVDVLTGEELSQKRA